MFYPSLLLVLVFSRSFNCASLRELVHLKYSRDLATPVTQAGEFPPFPTFAKVHLTDIKVDGLLQNFEDNPEAVYNNRHLDMHVIKQIVREYDTDPISRRIFQKCTESASSELFLSKALLAAARFNVPSVVELIASSYHTVNFESETFAGISPSFADEAIRYGSFNLLEMLILRGIYPDSAVRLAQMTCSFGSIKKIFEGIRFLNFLLVEREEFYLDEVLYDNGAMQFTAQLLKHVFNSHWSSFPAFSGQENECSPSVFKFRQAFVTFLMNAGADADELDINGKSPRDYALEQGISLNLKLSTLSDLN